MKRRRSGVTHPTAGIPRLEDGTPDLHAPAPRRSDGKPDIAGLWLPLQPMVVGNRAEPGIVPFNPWAEELWKWRYDTGAVAGKLRPGLTFSGPPRSQARP